MLTSLDRLWKLLSKNNRMFIEMKWSVLLQRNTTSMFHRIQSVEYFKKRKYRVKRSVFATLLFFLWLLILATKNSQRALRISSLWMIYTTLRLDLWATHIHRRNCRQRKNSWSQVWMIFCQHISASNWKHQVYKEVKYLALIHMRWICRLRDYSWKFWYRFIYSISRRTCHFSYNFISRLKICFNYE